MKAALLDQLVAARAARRAVVLLSALDSGAEALLPLDTDQPVTFAGADLSAAVRQAAERDRSGPVETDKGPVFIQVFNPPLRMIIVGAVHITGPLATIAGVCRFDVTVIDPRRAFASPERFPGMSLRHDWPDEALADLAPGPRDAIVTLTHDPKIDDPALSAALASPAFYIGALGSSRTHAKRLQRLAGAGFDEAALGRIHAPVGLDIGARSPAEIAASIIAEVIATLHRKPAP